MNLLLNDINPHINYINAINLQRGHTTVISSPIKT